LFEANEESPAKLSAQNSLYTALEAGLKLLHPFMPYVTEDLWQRIPRRPEDETPSIMVSDFPEAVSCISNSTCAGHATTAILIVQSEKQDFPEAYADFELTMSAIRSARSVAGLYNLATNGKTLEDKITVLIQVKNASVRTMLESQKDIIVALTKGSGQCLFVERDDEVPKGVGSEVVSTDVTVHIPVQVRKILPYRHTSCACLSRIRITQLPHPCRMQRKGHKLKPQGKVDAAAEISKLEKKADITQTNKDKLLKTMNQANYETTVREEVRKGNVEKVSLCLLL
jgi:valyl-tRNA synthetase